jgi:thiazole synthase ThiGH ThiG subunit
VVLIGRDAPLIRAALTHTGVSLLEAASMPQAVHAGQQAGAARRRGADVARLRQL